ncbi:MAG: ATP-binding protein [Chloroflexi bacterium OHK40]
MRLPIRTQLLGGFALDLLLMFALGYVAVQQMSVMDARAAFVQEHTIPSLDGVAAMNAVISGYRLEQLEYVLRTNPADDTRTLQRLAQLEQEMAGHLAAYRQLLDVRAAEMSTERHEAEHQLLDTVERAWGNLVAFTYERFIPDASVVTSGSVRPSHSRLNPLYDELDRPMEALTAESQRQANQALAVLDGAYATARGFIVVDTALAVVVSAAIGLILSGRIALRIRRLTSAAGRVAAGDLTPRVAVTSYDELGQLADAFNQMVASLSEQRRTLEQRNDALQASLARQQQLTNDLLRRQQAEEEAHRAQAAAEAASQAKSMFLATMSHELRTPLNAILGYAQLLRLTTPRPPGESEADLLDRILTAGRHLTGLISDVLDFSRVEQGALDLCLSHVDVGALTREAADVVAPLVSRHRNRLRIECPPEIGSIVSDAGRVRQILLNLLSNAAKFTEDGLITLRVSREEQTAGGEQIVFAISDTGIGIAPEDQARLFQPFSQVDSSVTRRYEGTGLGLALCRQLCIALGGTIDVASEPGIGSTFTVRLPVEASAGRPDSDLLSIAGTRATQP